MNSSAARISISLVIYVVWIAITLFGARLIAGGETDLDELVSTSVGWHFAAAIALLVTALVVFRWKDMRFTRPHSLVHIMWFPSIYLVFFAGGLIFVGAPSLSVVIFVVINTLMVGASEEIMFRGVLFRALEKAMPIWPAIIVTSVLFGAVHSLNVFITGDLMPSVIQSIAAGMSGLVFMAIVIRTGSIWPAIVYHFIWDCLLFLLGSVASAANPETAAADVGAIALFGPILLNLPNAIFALYLLRNVGGDLSEKGADQNEPLSPKQEREP